MHFLKRFNKHLCLVILGLTLFSSHASALQEVKLQLKWTHAFQFAGYYAAVHQGYYQDVGLDVQIIEGNPAISVIDEVRSGRANFGVSTSSLLLTQPIEDVVLLANIFQHSPLVFVTLDKGPFHTIHDFDESTIMLEDGSDELIAYLVKEGLSLENITLVPHSFSIDDLIQGEVDAMSSYLTFEIYKFNQADVDIKIFTPRSVGIDFYGDNLFTTRNMIESNPVVVEAFLEASLKGWTYALNNLDETIELILANYATSIDPDFLKYEAESMLQLIRPEFVEIGYVNPGRWKHIAEIYQELGFLNAPPNWNKFFFAPPQDNYTKWITLIMLVSVVTFLIAGIATYIFTVNKQLRKLLIQKQKDHSLKEKHNRILAMIANDQPLQSILTEINFSIEAYRPGCLCSIMLKPDNENFLTPIASPSLNAEYIEIIKQVPIVVGAGSCGTAAATRQRVVIADIQSHPYWRSFKEALVKADLKSCWSQPVMDHSGQVLATFAIYTREISEPTSADIRVIEEVAHLAAIAIDRSRMIELLKNSEQHHRYLAHHDPLTGLANRSLFSDRVVQAIRLAKREENHLAIILIDLNDFKLINDQHGHIVGDKLLSAIAKRLKTSVRISDTLSRYGGDEFVILLQGLMDTNEASIVEKKIFSLMSKPFNIDGLEIMSGCSIGIAYYPEDGPDETSLTHAADLRMYTNKRQLK
ncbi:diguanylate cyclase domain-containing protein [Nitrincola schmidtii]|uniref:diguanylate cyclase domain-containing protein n=1 Tax=Nitrincola schmidtii TaxID=1730894 RepID=UPI00124C1448|nr:diguanylate cyclase [Nitrincola schmidtii]